MTNPTSSDPLPLPPKKPQWPAHNAPRVWFLTDGLAPIAIALSKHLLEHGDYVVAGILPQEYSGSRGDELRGFMREVAEEGSGVGEEMTMEIDDDEEAEGEEEHGSDDYDDDDEEKEKSRESHGAAANGKGTKVVRKRWRERFKLVAIDGRNIGQCQSAIAEALAAFSRIDILLICRSEALIGTIEELNQSARTQSLTRDQFENNFFAPVNIIKALLPSMRDKRNGHIIAVTGITAHLGTPGLAMYCSSQWALEGYCDSLSYEIAPFNIKMTIVQPNLEIPVLTNRITSVPPMPEYSPDVNGAPLSRELLSGLLDKLDGELTLPPQAETPVAQEFTSPSSGVTASTPSASTPAAISPRTTNVDSSSGLTQGDLLHAPYVESLFPSLPATMKSPLVAETVFAIAAIGGHDNPPSRHIVGHEGVASVKEKLKTISEELEDFLGVSGAVDIDGGGRGGEVEGGDEEG